jgi:hypothetical protein
MHTMRRHFVNRRNVNRSRSGGSTRKAKNGDIFNATHTRQKTDVTQVQRNEVKNAPALRLFVGGVRNYNFR